MCKYAVLPNLHEKWRKGLSTDVMTPKTLRPFLTTAKQASLSETQKKPVMALLAPKLSYELLACI